MALVVFFAAWASLVDARRRELPNALVGALALTALALQAIRAFLPGWLAFLPWEAALSARLEPPVACLALAIGIFAVLAALELWRRRRGRNAGLGFGDVKLAFGWTLALGVLGLWALALGAGTGALVAWRRGERTFALGPWMSGWASALAIIAAVWPGLGGIG